MAALVLLPIEVSDAGRLSDVVKGSSKHGRSPKHVHLGEACRLAEVPHREACRPRAGRPFSLKPVATMCDRSKFRIVLDVGHTAVSEGATSARNVAEFVFNLRLAQRIEEKLRSEGFPEARLLLTEGKARPSLVKRVAAANDLHANLFLSIYHDSVPNSSLRTGNSRVRKAISATASAVIPSTCG